MSRRSPARWIAPAALAAVGLAVLAILRGGGEDSGTTSTDATPRVTSTPRTTTGEGATRTTRTTSGRGGSGAPTYTVKAGDVPSAIAESTGVSLERLQQLNPDLDPTALRIGQRLKLR